MAFCYAGVQPGLLHVGNAVELLCIADALVLPELQRECEQVRSDWQSEGARLYVECSSMIVPRTVSRGFDPLVLCQLIEFEYLDRESAVLLLDVCNRSPTLAPRLALACRSLCSD